MKIVSLVLIFFMFSNNGYFIENNKNCLQKRKVISDTINPKHKTPLNSKCFKISKGYFKRFGLTISKFYEVSKVLPIDLNNDKRVDTLVILTPLSLIPNAEQGGVCYRKNIVENRLLLEILNLKNHQKLSKKFNNLISNESSIAWLGYEDIKVTNNGFELLGYRGQSCIFEYNISVVNKNSEFYIDNIKLKSSCSKKKQLNLNLKKKPLKLFKYDRKMIDSIKLVNNM